MATIAGSSAAEDIQRAGRRRIEAARRLLRRIEDARPSFGRANVLDPLNELALEIANASGEAGLLSEVHPEAAVRQAAEDVVRETDRFRTELLQHRSLYEVLREVDAADLDGPARRALELTCMDMRRGGVELSDEDRARVKALRDELVVVGQEFSRVIRDDVRTIELRGADELDGLPADYVAAHRPGADGTIRISTDYPDSIPFMMYAKSDRARRALSYAFNNRGVPRNLEVLATMLRKRHELARLLGYENWAEYATEDKMLSSADAVRRFLAEAREATVESGLAERADVLETKRKDAPDATAIGVWEAQYYLQKVKTERWGFDARELRPYFEYRTVRQAILELMSELFGLTFTRARDFEPWHPSVETFDVEVEGVAMGRISLDMHPREGKFKHAACFDLRLGVRGEQLPHGVLVCNFPDPNVTSPALMDHREVVTYFHEFGHLVHLIVSGKVEWTRCAWHGEWDFVEAPSQFLEEWIYDHDVLRRFARHVETGEAIPARLVEKLRETRDFGRAVFVQQQLFYAALSLFLHDRDPQGLDTTKVVFDLAERHSPFELLPDTKFQASFGHLEGYSALYYSYMTSLAASKDLYSFFEAKGLMDFAQVRRYRDLILAPGGTKPAADLMRDLLGRPHGLEAFKEWLAPKPLSRSIT